MTLHGQIIDRNSAVWEDTNVTRHTIEREIWVPRPIDEVFAFFSDAGNLDRLTPPWLHFRILTPKVTMAQGTRIDYALRIHGIPLRWQSEITAWQPPFRFVDEQRKGPYRAWIHEHSFAAHEGGTRVRDVVEYEARGGELVRRMLVAPDLEKIFNYRTEQLSRIWATTPA